MRKMELSPRRCFPDHCSEHFPENMEDTSKQSLFFSRQAWWPTDKQVLPVAACPHRLPPSPLR